MYLIGLIALCGLADSETKFSTSNWNGLLAAGSGVLQSLQPSNGSSFDFSPSDYFGQRNGVGNYHTGDMVLRWRHVGDNGWATFDTALDRNHPPVHSRPAGVLLQSNFSGNGQIAGSVGLIRDWVERDGDLVLLATITNPSHAVSLELGSFGFPIEFNSIFVNRTADDTTAKCSLIDPYIGADAGYVQVTRLTGTGPHLVITPYGQQTKLEGWRFLPEQGGPPLYYQSQTFEGFYSWEVLTKAWADNEWNSTTPWNRATSATLAPGASLTYGLRFSRVASVHDIEPAVASLGKPVAVGLPGYIIPQDLEARLFLRYKSPVSSIVVEPARSLTFQPTSSKNPAWRAFKVAPGRAALGRARVTIGYQDGATQTVHYVLTRSARETADKLGDFFFKQAWFTDRSDPFGRANSIITYDYEAGAQVTQERRVYIAGIADEAGSVHVALDMKSAVHPDAAEIQKLESMANTSLLGHLQNRGGSQPNGVRRSLFFYEPSVVPKYPYSANIDWAGSWNRDDAYSIWRAYDYVHASAVYYGLYRASRVAPGILKAQTPLWYLNQAYETVMASQAVDSNGTPVTAYADVGLMGETMWVQLLEDLKAENLTDQYTRMRAQMESRTRVWAAQSSPFGSEMAWDSTGQEPIYAWARYFGNAALQTKVLDSIRGYMPTVAHWGWNGNARRYWDFVYGGKLARIERMIHHYGSGLNALPLLTSYKYNAHPSGPEALYDLRVGYGGTMGPLSNINADGFASTAFHSFPDTMKWDGYSGDFGPNYLGVVLGSCTFLVDHPDFGWVSMGGNLESTDAAVTVLPRDTVRRSIYIASIGLHVSFDGGEILKFVYAPASKRVTIYLGRDVNKAPATVMQFESTLGQSIKLEGGTAGGRLGGDLVRLPGKVTFSA